MTYKKLKEQFMLVVVGGIVVIVIMLCCLIIAIQSMKYTLNKIEIIDNHDEYIWYVDGNEVDYDQIDLNQYDMTFDIDKKEVYLH